MHCSPSLFCPLIFCTAEAVTVCSYKAIWEICITENTFQAWKSTSTRLVQHTHKTKSALFFPSKESRNLSMEARLDYIIFLLLHWLEELPLLGLHWAFCKYCSTEIHKCHRSLNLWKFCIRHLDRISAFFVILEFSIQTYVLNSTRITFTIHPDRTDKKK